LSQDVGRFRVESSEVEGVREFENVQADAGASFISQIWSPAGCDVASINLLNLKLNT
jgi:hypothetical protein